MTLVHGTPADPRLPERSVDLAILAHMYHEIEHPYEFLYRLQAALAPGARVAIIDNDKPTRDHGTPPALLRCELGALGYRQIDFTLLAPADGYLAVFAPPEAMPGSGGHPTVSSLTRPLRLRWGWPARTPTSAIMPAGCLMPLDRRTPLTLGRRSRRRRPPACSLR